MSKVQECYFLTVRLPYLLLGPDATNDLDHVLDSHITHEKKATVFYEVDSLHIAEKLLELFRYGKPEPITEAEMPARPAGSPEAICELLEGTSQPILGVLDAATLNMPQRICCRQHIGVLEQIEDLGDGDPGMWEEVGLPHDRATLLLMKFRLMAREWEPLVRDELSTDGGSVEEPPPDAGSKDDLQSVYARKVKKLLDDCIEQLRSFRFCGPSDDPDEQMNVTLAYRDLLVQLKRFAGPLLPTDMAARLDSMEIDLNNIYSVYEANPEVQALLPFIEAVLETTGEDVPPMKANTEAPASYTSWLADNIAVDEDLLQLRFTFDEAAQKLEEISETALSPSGKPYIRECSKALLAFAEWFGAQEPEDVPLLGNAHRITYALTPIPGIIDWIGFQYSSTSANSIEEDVVALEDAAEALDKTVSAIYKVVETPSNTRHLKRPLSDDEHQTISEGIAEVAGRAYNVGIRLDRLATMMDISSVRKGVIPPKPRTRLENLIYEKLVDGKPRTDGQLTNQLGANKNPKTGKAYTYDGVKKARQNLVKRGAIRKHPEKVGYYRPVP